MIYSQRRDIVRCVCFQRVLWNGVEAALKEERDWTISKEVINHSFHLSLE